MRKDHPPKSIIPITTISYHSFLLELQPLLFLFPFFGTFVKQQPLLQRNFQHAQPFLGGVQLVWTGSKIQHERKHWSENGLLPEMNKKMY
jgi:hypothetical protein